MIPLPKENKLKLFPNNRKPAINSSKSSYLFLRPNNYVGGDQNIIIIIIIIFSYTVHHSLAPTRNAILIIQHNDKTVNAQWI